LKHNVAVFAVCCLVKIMVMAGNQFCSRLQLI